MADLTKQALAEAAMTLLESKPLEKITIKDITDTCGVNRNTFYYHFRDVYDLLSWIFAEETGRIVLKYKDDSNWVGGFAEALDYLLEHKKMIYHVYNSTSRENLEKYLYKILGQKLLDIIETKTKDCDISENVKKTVANFYQCTFVGGILKWIGDGMDTEPEVLAHITDVVFESTLEPALKSVKDIPEAELLKII